MLQSCLIMSKSFFNLQDVLARKSSGFLVWPRANYDLSELVSWSVKWIRTLTCLPPVVVMRLKWETCVIQTCPQINRRKNRQGYVFCHLIACISMFKYGLWVLSNLYFSRSFLYTLDLKTSNCDVFFLAVLCLVRLLSKYSLNPTLWGLCFSSLA